MAELARDMHLEASIVHMLNDRQGVRVLLYLQLTSDDITMKEMLNSKSWQLKTIVHCLLLKFAEVHCRSSCFH